MTTITGGGAPLRAPRASAFHGMLDAARRNLHAFTVTVWHIPLANLELRAIAAARAYAERRRARRDWQLTRERLLELDDRTLADIGLDRYRVERASSARELRRTPWN